MGRELDGRLVLVVEDDSTTLEGLAALLEEAGASVEKAATLAEALLVLQRALAQRARPEAIVCDLLLPDGSGMRLPGEIWKLDPAWHVLLVAISAYPEAEEPARNAGFHDFIPKLVTPLLPLALAHLFRVRP